MAKLNINGKVRDVAVEADTPLLWVIREQVGLTGTKYGCGVAQCGACSVHINGEVVRSCSMPVGSVKADRPHRHHRGPVAERARTRCRRPGPQLDVPQCGYCQSGQIMAAAALLAKNPNPTDADIDAAMTNICRCGTYQRIRAGGRTGAAADNAPGASARRRMKTDQHRSAIRRAAVHRHHRRRRRRPRPRPATARSPSTRRDKARRRPARRSTPGSS